MTSIYGLFYQRDEISEKETLNNLGNCYNDIFKK